LSDTVETLQVLQLFIDSNKVCDSVRREVFCIIHMCLNETSSKVLVHTRIAKGVSDEFLIQNGQKQVDALSSVLFNFGLEYAIRKA
jgi:hypothetical protein